MTKGQRVTDSRKGNSLSPSSGFTRLCETRNSETDEKRRWIVRVKSALHVGQMERMD